MELSTQERIGYRIKELLGLRQQRDNKRINTSWGDKTIFGLGACVQRIVEEETNN